LLADMPISEQYDFDAVLDDARIGDEPSAGYVKRVQILDSVVRNCMFLSRQYGGIPAPTSRHFYASVLFTALITRGVSLAIVAPHSPWATKLIEHWDYATATGIVRTMLELRFAFHYLCVDQCTDEEWNCRWNILNLHDCTARRRLFEARQTDPKQVEGFEKQAEELRERLRNNSHFAGLPTKQRKTFLNGQTAYLYPLENIGERAGVEKSLFRWLLILFSSHVHGLPMSYYRIAVGEQERGRGLPSSAEEGYTSLCLSFAAQLLVKTHDEIEVLFADSVKQPVLNMTTAEEQNPEAALASKEGFPVGEAKTISKTDTVRIEVTRTAEDVIRIVYYAVPKDEIVLRRVLAEKAEDSALEFYDRTFWNVLVNGMPATDTFLDGIVDKRMAYKIDPNKQELHFKIE